MVDFIVFCCTVVCFTFLVCVTSILVLFIILNTYRITVSLFQD